MSIFVKIINKLKYWLIALLSLPFLCSSFIYADDLMRQIMEPAYSKKTTIDVWKNVNKVWKNVFEDWEKIKLTLEWPQTQKVPSMIVKITRILLSLVVALSVTMILYNGMIYIVQTWQWKEWKSLVKNVVYIVIWILISLFSVTIITLLKSVSYTLKEETQVDWSRDADNNIVYSEDRKWARWGELFNFK